MDVESGQQPKDSEPCPSLPPSPPPPILPLLGTSKRRSSTSRILLQGLQLFGTTTSTKIRSRVQRGSENTSTTILLPAQEDHDGSQQQNKQQSEADSESNSPPISESFSETNSSLDSNLIGYFHYDDGGDGDDDSLGKDHPRLQIEATGALAHYNNNEGGPICRGRIISDKKTTTHRDAEMQSFEEAAERLRQQLSGHICKGKIDLSQISFSSVSSTS